MIGLRTGLTVGLQTGLGGLNAAASFSTDATSGKGVPADAAEWDIWAAAVGAPGGPDSLHLCQESSGNLADSIGSMTLTAYGAGLSYNDAVTGWARSAAGIATGGAIRGWDTAGGPDAAATSVAMLVYASVAVVGGTRTLFNLNEEAGFTTEAWVNFSGANNMVAVSGAVSSTAGSATYTGGLNAVIPLLFVNDRVNSRIKLYSDVEVISGSYVSITNAGRRGFGGGQFNLSATARYLYAAWFSGANAAWLSTSANAKAALEGLNWTVTGY